MNFLKTIHFYLLANYKLHIVNSQKEVMFLAALLCLLACWCATLLNTFWMDWHEILWRNLGWYNDNNLPNWLNTLPVCYSKSAFAFSLPCSWVSSWSPWTAVFFRVVSNALEHELMVVLIKLRLTWGLLGDQVDALIPQRLPALISGQYHIPLEWHCSVCVLMVKSRLHFLISLALEVTSHPGAGNRCKDIQLYTPSTWIQVVTVCILSWRIHEFEMLNSFPVPLHNDSAR